MNVLIINKYKIQVLSADQQALGYDFIESEPVQESELTVAVPYYELQGNVVYQRWELKESQTKVLSKIKALKDQLSQSDYKVIKNQEYLMAGKAECYGAELLYNDRQDLRQQIEALELLLK